MMRRTMSLKRSGVVLEVNCGFFRSPWGGRAGRGTGPACHTGERTCFHRGELEPPAPHEVLPGLERTIAQRATQKPDGSYTAELLADPRRIGEKVQEEAEEIARAAQSESDERVAEEAADVVYHLTVLLKSRDLSLADAERILDGRRQR